MSTMPADSARSAAPGPPPALPHSTDCVACCEPLPEGETVCPRCNSQNKAWQEWRERTSRLTPEVLVNELRWLLPGALVLAPGWVVGLLFFVWAGGVWGVRGGLVIAFLGLLFATLAMLDEWAAREERREQRAVAAVARALEKPDIPHALVGLMRATLRAWVPISYSVVAGLLAPLGLVAYPALLRALAGFLGLSDPQRAPAPGSEQVLEVFLGVAYWMAYVVAAQVVAGQGLRSYFAAARDHAPPYIFARQAQFYDLCKQEARHALLHPDGGEPKVTWLSITRRPDAGMELRAMLTVGNKKLEMLDEMRSTHLPIHKNYVIVLDRWARAMSVKEDKEK